VQQEVFHFKEQGLDSAGKVQGEFESSGIRPKFLSKLEAYGIKIPNEIFTDDAPALRRPLNTRAGSRY
jgi:pilus assembly protein CpaF